ncbi:MULTISPECIES: dethiobiotin synthase [unclassified Synechocystis]|uniref:dethiobiotin synthase n=1 Tax=unclassified Synechocystis TaxID=2640012 RepID=UPI0003FCF689|nr:MULTISPECIES: dethiobiotin synthase [unclassified Synechocystis]AIE73067.1 Dethiobiotin synthetase [Synechocystis sp. PCC 6714]MCT0254401.1 dethiobiotin synthase [Synechocystis sp. CS-94]
MSNFSRAVDQKTLLVVGCDTGVGKTVTTSALAAYWQRYGKDQSFGLMKLMQTGLGDDELYQKLFGHLTHWDVVTPLKFAAPLAPPLAADQEGKTIDLGVVWQTLQTMQQNHGHVLVEALGSLGSPVTHELTVADIAGLWHLETILVVPVQLGAMGQAIAQVALARETKVKLKGLVLSCATPDAEAKLEDWATPSMLESFTHLPVVGIVPYLTDTERENLDCLAQVTAQFDLEKLDYF